MEFKAQVMVTLILSAILAVVAFFDANWMWFIINLLCVMMLVIPSVKDLGYYYNQKVIVLIMVAPLATIALAMVNMFFPVMTERFLDVTIYTYMAAAIQAYQCFVIGFMVALVMDKSFGLTMTPIWMMVFSIGFAMTLSALDMFFTFMELYLSGYPVFNEDFVDTEVYTNGILMAAPFVTTFVSLAMAIIVGNNIRGRDKSAFIIRMGEGA